MLDEKEIFALIEATVQPYESLYSPEELEEMRRSLRVAFESHPVVGPTVRALYPAPNADRSGERADDDADDVAPGKAGGEGA